MGAKGSHCTIKCKVLLHFQLQEYYDFLAEKLGADISSTIVWKGAAKNKKIKHELKDVVEDSSYLVCHHTSTIVHWVYA